MLCFCCMWCKHLYICYCRGKGRLGDCSCIYLSWSWKRQCWASSWICPRCAPHTVIKWSIFYWYFLWVNKCNGCQFLESPCSLLTYLIRLQLLLLIICVSMDHLWLERFFCCRVSSWFDWINGRLSFNTTSSTSLSSVLYENWRWRFRLPCWPFDCNVSPGISYVCYYARSFHYQNGVCHLNNCFAQIPGI